MLERITVNPSSEVPMFRQLSEQIKGLIADGTLRPGDELPSARQLAKHLGVNPMTISKAVSQLTDEGWLIYQRGHPSRVAERITHNKDIKEDWLTPTLEEVVSRAKQMNISRSKVEQLLKILWDS